VTLVDTSAWIESLRPSGNRAVAGRVRSFLVNGDAAWCAMVSLELRNGARGDHEKAVLRDRERNLIDLDMPPAVWDLTSELARKTRGAGHTIPPTDILIAACARHHGTAVEHKDGHFDTLDRVR
jgi:predicted nucleic acid-binding protein